ncbi:hypothetical protein Bca101_087449 [Brassica carinata]
MWALWPYRSQPNQLHCPHLTVVNPIYTENYLLDSAFTPPNRILFVFLVLWHVITIEHVLGVLRWLQLSLFFF